MTWVTGLGESVVDEEESGAAPAGPGAPSVAVEDRPEDLLDS